MADTGSIEAALLQQLASAGGIPDSGVFAEQQLHEDHLKVVGVLKSLEQAEMIAMQVRVRWWLECGIGGAVTQGIRRGGVCLCAACAQAASSCVKSLLEVMAPPPSFLCQHFAPRPLPMAALPTLSLTLLSHPPTTTNNNKQDITHSKYVLTPEAEAYLTAGSPEAQLFAAVPPGVCRVVGGGSVGVC